MLDAQGGVLGMKDLGGRSLGCEPVATKVEHEMPGFAKGKLDPPAECLAPSSTMVVLKARSPPHYVSRPTSQCSKIHHAIQHDRRCTSSRQAPLDQKMQLKEYTHSLMRAYGAHKSWGGRMLLC